jgi:hypothetical protein
VHDITKYTQIGIFGLKIYIIWQTWIRPPQTEDVCMSNTPPGQKQDCFVRYRTTKMKLILILLDDIGLSMTKIIWRQNPP